MAQAVGGYITALRRLAKVWVIWVFAAGGRRKTAYRISLKKRAQPRFMEPLLRATPPLREYTALSQRCRRLSRVKSFNGSLLHEPGLWRRAVLSRCLRRYWRACLEAPSRHHPPLRKLRSSCFALSRPSFLIVLCLLKLAPCVGISGSTRISFRCRAAVVQVETAAAPGSGHSRTRRARWAAKDLVEGP